MYVPTTVVVPVVVDGFIVGKVWFLPPPHRQSYCYRPCNQGINVRIGIGTETDII